MFESVEIRRLLKWTKHANSRRNRQQRHIKFEAGRNALDIVFSKRGGNKVLRKKWNGLHHLNDNSNEPKQMNLEHMPNDETHHHKLIVMAPENKRAETGTKQDKKNERWGKIKTGSHLFLFLVCVRVCVLYFSCVVYKKKKKKKCVYRVKSGNKIYMTGIPRIS